MQVITTHFSADFDCMAAMVAAQKLYPEAKMVFSGSMEKPLQEYLIKREWRSTFMIIIWTWRIP